MLQSTSPARSRYLEAILGAYPGYRGALRPNGVVKVDLFDDDTFKFDLSIQGVNPNCTNCGVHIHAGTTCSKASLVGDHYWNKVVYGEVDPWTAANGSYYNSDIYGNSNRFFYLDNGFGFDGNKGHAVVVHTKNGTRIGCGTLVAK